jgi:hypothetical protein
LFFLHLNSSGFGLVILTSTRHSEVGAGDGGLDGSGDGAGDGWLDGLVDGLDDGGLDGSSVSKLLTS